MNVCDDVLCGRHDCDWGSFIKLVTTRVVAVFCHLLCLPTRCDTRDSPSFGSVSFILRLPLGFTHTVGDYPGSRQLSNMHDFRGTNRIVSQCQFNIEKVGDYPGSRQLFKVQTQNHRILHFVATSTSMRDYLF